MVVALALGAVLGLSLAIVAAARTPARIMRKRSFADSVIRGRREIFFWAGMAAALGIGLGLLIALESS